VVAESRVVIVPPLDLVVGAAFADGKDSAEQADTRKCVLGSEAGWVDGSQ
jgi:hypothetical protein